MQSDFRVKELVTEEGGDVIAICYDVLYGETFEKYIGIPDDFDGKENASNLLQDSNYEISDEIRAELEETFGLAEFDDDQDFDGYQFYDFDEEEEDEEDFAVPTKYLRRESFNLREALNTIDLNTYNKYDLLNLYESCNLSENEKRALANIVYDQEDAEVIYDTLNNRYVKGEEIGMPERVKDGVIHEELDVDSKEIYSFDAETTMTLEKDNIIDFPNAYAFTATFDEGEYQGKTFSFVGGKGAEDFLKSVGRSPAEEPVWFLKVDGKESGFFCDVNEWKDTPPYLRNPNQWLFMFPNYQERYMDIDKAEKFLSNNSSHITQLGDRIYEVDVDIDDETLVESLNESSAKTFSQWFDETQHYSDDDEFYPFSNYIKKFPNAEILKDATAEDIRDNAHRFYDTYDVDSVDREKAFHFASEELGIDYDAFYYAWMNDQPMKGVNESVDEFEFDDEIGEAVDE